MAAPRSAAENRFGGYPSQRALAAASAAALKHGPVRHVLSDDGRLAHVAVGGGYIICHDSQHDREYIRREWYALRRDTPSDPRVRVLGEYLEAVPA